MRAGPAGLLAVIVAFAAAPASAEGIERQAVGLARDICFGETLDQDDAIARVMATLPVRKDRTVTVPGMSGWFGVPREGSDHDGLVLVTVGTEDASSASYLKIQLLGDASALETGITTIEGLSLEPAPPDFESKREGARTLIGMSAEGLVRVTVSPAPAGRAGDPPDDIAFECFAAQSAMNAPGAPG